MRPSVVVEGARVFLGDCRDVLKTLPDNSVDSIVTDPPYGLNFMGKEWDNPGKMLGQMATGHEQRGAYAYGGSHSRGYADNNSLGFQLWCTEWAVECLRVLKPGGHILAFGGTRTWHRLAVAIEDAGFEIRDNIAWLYGSGFPKSLDVSKAIDKRRDETTDKSRVALELRNALLLSGKNRQEIDEHFGTANVSQYWFSPERNAQIVPAEKWPWVRDWLGIGSELDAEVWRLNGRKGKPGENWDKREVIGHSSNGIAGGTGKHAGEEEAYGFAKDFDLTAPSTPEAQQWQGWGTALKPAFEPVVVGRKPLVGTVAENVLLWGVGGLNIDGSRIGNEKRTYSGGSKLMEVRPWNKSQDEKPEYQVQGRWPANVVLDEFTAGLLDEQSGQQKDGTATGRPNKGIGYEGGWGPMPDVRHGFGGQGGASRFFYQAKASKRDRNEGLEDLGETQRGQKYGLTAGGTSPQQTPHKDEPVKNFHPTVKPTQLMRYLIKLVTPEGGTVLDPFTGSGSTGKAALLDGYEFIGAELTEEYLPIIEGRLRWAVENRNEETLF